MAQHQTEVTVTFDRMRAKASRPLVKPEFGNAGYLDGAMVLAAIDSLEKRMKSAMLEPLSPLEKLAALLLMEWTHGGVVPRKGFSHAPSN